MDHVVQGIDLKGPRSGGGEGRERRGGEGQRGKERVLPTAGAGGSAGHIWSGAGEGTHKGGVTERATSPFPRPPGILARTCDEQGS